MSRMVTILGAGESGLGAAKLAVKKGYSVFLSDFSEISTDNQKVLTELGVDFEEKGHSDEKILSSDLIIKSPGIPDTAPIVLQAISQRIPVISEIEFGYRFIDNNAKVIAITGTNGKTTTTLLTYHLLKEAGMKVALTGNVGFSLAGKVAESGFDYYVVEVSSFQLDGIDSFQPDVAVLLNITPDHLDRYQNDFKKYVDSKFRITENLTGDQCFIFSADSQPIKEEITRRNLSATLLSVSGSRKINNGGFIQDDHLVIDFEHSNDKVTMVIPKDEVSLVGNHNYINTLSAVLAGLSVGVSKSEITRGLKTFKNAPHRMEFITQIKGVSFINDSKATNVDAVYYALESIPKDIIWIAGGVDKGNDYTQIKTLVQNRVKGLICLGKDNEALKNQFQSSVDSIAETESLKEVMDLATSWAASGDVVMLSPACASFDLFRNYEERGDLFREVVLSHKKSIEV